MIKNNKLALSALALSIALPSLSSAASVGFFIVYNNLFSQALENTIANSAATASPILVKFYSTSTLVCDSVLLPFKGYVTEPIGDAFPANWTGTSFSSNPGPSGSTNYSTTTSSSVRPLCDKIDHISVTARPATATGQQVYITTERDITVANSSGVPTNYATYIAISNQDASTSSSVPPDGSTQNPFFSAISGLVLGNTNNASSAGTVLNNSTLSSYGISHQVVATLTAFE